MRMLCALCFPLKSPNFTRSQPGALRRAREPQRTPRQCHLMANWVCVCVWVGVLVCVLWSLPALLLLLLPFFSFLPACLPSHLHLSKWVSSSCCRVSSLARLMIMLIFAFRNNLLWTYSFLLFPLPPSGDTPPACLSFVVDLISTCFLTAGVLREEGIGQVQNFNSVRNGEIL